MQRSDYIAELEEKIAEYELRIQQYERIVAAAELACKDYEEDIAALKRRAGVTSRTLYRLRSLAYRFAKRHNSNPIVNLAIRMRRVVLRCRRK